MGVVDAHQIQSVLRLRLRVTLAIAVATVIISVVLPSFSLIDIDRDNNYHDSESERIQRGAPALQASPSHATGSFSKNGNMNDTAAVIPTATNSTTRSSLALNQKAEVVGVASLPPAHSTSCQDWIVSAEDLNRTVLAYPLETWWQPHSPTASTTASTTAGVVDGVPWPLQDLGLKVFVYDPSKWPVELATAGQCLLDHYVVGNASKHAPSFDNRITDVGLIQLFRTFPGRTYDPEQADVFVVPYPHASHCMSEDCRRSGPYQPNCGGVPQSMINELIEKHLTYFQGDYIDRHLFILSTSHQLNKKLQMAALKFVIGGRIYKYDRQSQSYLARMNPRHKYNPQQLGNFIVPYMNTHPWMQPSVIRSRPQEWWTSTTRPRKYSFVYIFGGKNSRSYRNSRIYRRRFENHINKTIAKKKMTWNSTTGTTTPALLGGLPFRLISNPSALTPEAMLKMYQDSTFCPCLPGDTVTQKRFFDVILSGCLPVVLKFPHGRNNVTSWHPFENSLVENTFPFAHAQQFLSHWQDNRDDDHHHHGMINYSSFVVEIELPIDAGTMEKGMAKLLLPENAAELHRRQQDMRRVAPLLTYGLGPDNAHRYEDAFSTLLRALKRYLDNSRWVPPRNSSRIR